MNKPLSNSQTRAAEALLHPYAPASMIRDSGVLVIDHGEGIRVFDESGRSYIEAMSGLWCAGLGFGNEELVETAAAQMRKLPYYHVFSGKSHEPAIALAEKIKELAPGNMARVFYQSSGSEANETQVKLAWYYNNARGLPDKKKIIARKGGYHGVSIVAASMTGLPYNHKDFDLPVDRIKHTSAANYWKFGHEGESEEDYTARILGELEELILAEGPDTVAAFIAEPVKGAGGVVIPPKGYFEGVNALCDKYDILTISDEVICGFGRTGEWFGAQTLNYKPTSLSMAKQLTSAYFPLSAVAINGAMAEAIEANSSKIGTFGHGFTYGGHPVGCAVGLKTLEIYERMDMPARVRSLAPRFAGHLDRLGQHPLVGEARHVGLIGALELAPNRSAKGFAEPGKVGRRVVQELGDRGIISRAIVDSLAFCPPMIITEDEIDEMFAPVEAALDATMVWAKAEGHLG